MERSGKIILALASCALAWAVYREVTRPPAMPYLPLRDVTRTESAGKLESISGHATSRLALPSDERIGPTAERRQRLPASAWRDISTGSDFSLETVFRLEEGTVLSALTTGNWMVRLTGEGEFLAKDARTDETRTRHTGSWIVRSGTIQARPLEYDAGDHWLELVTSAARVQIHEGEVRLRVLASGRGELWLQGGAGTIILPDGAVRKLSGRGMEYL